MQRFLIYHISFLTGFFLSQSKIHFFLTGSKRGKAFFFFKSEASIKPRTSWKKCVILTDSSSLPVVWDGVRSQTGSEQMRVRLAPSLLKPHSHIPLSSSSAHLWNTRQIWADIRFPATFSIQKVLYMN